MDSDELKLLAVGLAGVYLFSKLEIGKTISGVNNVIGAVGQTTGQIGTELTTATTKYAPLFGGNQLASVLFSLNPFSTPGRFVIDQWGRLQ